MMKTAVSTATGYTITIRNIGTASSHADVTVTNTDGDIIATVLLPQENATLVLAEALYA